MSGPVWGNPDPYGIHAPTQKGEELRNLLRNVPKEKSPTEQILDQLVEKSMDAMREVLMKDRAALIRSGWPADDLTVGSYPDGSRAVASIKDRTALGPPRRMSISSEDGFMKITVS